MRLRLLLPSVLLFTASLLALPSRALAQKHLSKAGSDPFAPKETPNNRKLPPPKPVDVPTAYEPDREKLVKLDSAMAPALDTVRKTLKLVQRRWLKGLPKGDQLFVTTRVYDTKTGEFEHVLVRVDKWMASRIFGPVSSVLSTTGRFKPGEIMNLDPTNVVDWKIKHADGSEEGNYVARFLDEYYTIQTGHAPASPLAK